MYSSFTSYCNVPIWGDTPPIPQGIPKRNPHLWLAKGIASSINNQGNPKCQRETASIATGGRENIQQGVTSGEFKTWRFVLGVLIGLLKNVKDLCCGLHRILCCGLFVLWVYISWRICAVDYTERVSGCCACAGINIFQRRLDIPWILGCFGED